MKKLLFLMMTLGVIMTACKKDEGPKVSLDGNQWITEELAAVGDIPAGMFLCDFGAKSGAGKMTTVLVVTEGNSEFNEGDLILMYKGSYTYDASTGKLNVDGDESVVEFITDTKAKISVAGVELIFSLVEGKQYPVKDAKEFEPAPEEFEITPSKSEDWAGGSIIFTSNRTIKSLTYDVLTEGLTEQQEICKTTLTEDQVLTLGQYVAAGSALANCQIQIKAADEDGNETTCIVTSKAWRPAVYTKYKGEYTEDDLSQGWTRGAECWLGAVSTMDEITYDGTSDTFEGISYKVPDFMTPVGDDIDKVCYDTPSTNHAGTITYTYGALSFELTIDIDR